MSAKPIPNTKSPNTRKERNHSLLKEEEDTTTNKKGSVDRRNQSLRRKPKLPKKSL
jgi:hypothetical protein